MIDDSGHIRDGRGPRDLAAQGAARVPASVLGFEGRVEAFASLCARLDDPFADSSELLAALHLAPRKYDELREAWHAEIARDKTGELARRFAAAYREASSLRLARARGMAPPEEEVDPPRTTIGGTRAAVSEALEGTASAAEPTAPERCMVGLDLETGEVDVRMFRRPVLPFGAKPPTGDTPEAAKGTEVPLSAGPASDGAETVVITPETLVRNEILPFSPDGTLTMSLEEYAKFRAVLAADGEENPAVLRRFGVPSVAAKAALQADFARRFRADPSLQARFVELVRHAGGRRGNTR